MNKYEQSFFGYAILGYLSELNGSVLVVFWWILALVSIILGLIKERTEL